MATHVPRESTFCQFQAVRYGTAVPNRTHPLLRAVTPVADALGTAVVPPGQMAESDIPLVWEGEVVGAVRRPDLHDALEHLLVAAERELGVARADMDRTQKQEAVTLLNTWGAFTLRKSVEDVAEAIGVSRFTVYNYLERAEAGR